ncbi:Protein of unknown function, partial [Cotesia congregata]
ETIRKSAGNTIVKVEKQWHSAGLPVCGRENAVKKLIELHFKWKGLQKNKSKKNSPAQMKNQSLFQTKLAELFDITDQKILQSINYDKKIFLEGQKSSNQRGIINLSSQPDTEADVKIADEINQPVKDKQISIIKQESDLITSQSSASLTSKSVSDFENELTPPIVP